MYNRCSTPKDVEEIISADIGCHVFHPRKDSQNLFIGSKADKKYLSVRKPINTIYRFKSR